MTTRWIVIIKRDTAAPEVTPFEREDDAREFFDRWSLQWSESYLCQVVIGPGPEWRQS